MLFGGLMAVGSLFFAVTGASANWPEFESSRLCDDSWTAEAQYFGPDERLAILSGVTINGVPLTSEQTGGRFQPYSPEIHGVTDPPTSGGLAWLGTSPGFTIFSLSGNGFTPEWSGNITVFRPVGNVWYVGHGTNVTPPTSPANCAPSTATPTTPATADASTPVPTNTAPAATNTVTNQAPVSTATPPNATPPCTLPGSGQTPTGGSVVCTPTPVDSVAGVRTPGPGVPSAGTGFSSDLSNTNVVFALLGLLAVTAGAAFMAMGRREEED